MINLTKPQRHALLLVYRRTVSETRQTMSQAEYMRFTYRAFRRTVQPTIGCDGCVMVRFAGMWLGIEQDGYTHS